MGAGREVGEGEEKKDCDGKERKGWGGGYGF